MVHQIDQSIFAMANADPENGIQTYEDDIGNEDVDSDLDDTDGASSSKQNGVPARVTDRYGFIGGDQYTDPDR